MKDSDISIRTREEYDDLITIEQRPNEVKHKPSIVDLLPEPSDEVTFFIMFYLWPILKYVYFI